MHNLSSAGLVRGTDREQPSGMVLKAACANRQFIVHPRSHISNRTSQLRVDPLIRLLLYLPMWSNALRPWPSLLTSRNLEKVPFPAREIVLVHYRTIWISQGEHTKYFDTNIPLPCLRGATWTQRNLK